jgi:hypothetical protein
VALLTFVLVLTNTAEMSRLARRVDALGERLPSRSDVAMARPLRIGVTLERHCTSCHSDRKFKEAYGVGPHPLTDAVMRHPGSERLDRAQAERISAAMILTRCTSCHGEEVVGELGLRSRQRRLEYLRRKVREQRPLFETHEVRHVLWSIETLLGEPRTDDADPPSPQR